MTVAGVGLFDRQRAIVSRVKTPHIRHCEENWRQLPGVL
jgi:hypothetical protein